jgi:hypothetical protein
LTSYISQGHRFRRPVFFSQVKSDDSDSLVCWTKQYCLQRYLAAGFGEDEVTKLCTRLKMSGPHVFFVNAFRDYVDAGRRRSPSELQSLVNCTHIIACTTAECERGFSHMNIIISDTRSQLLISNVSSLLFIKLHACQRMVLPGGHGIRQSMPKCGCEISGLPLARKHNLLHQRT